MKFLALSFGLCLLFVSTFAQNMIKDEDWLKNYFAQLKKTYDKRVHPTDEKNPGSPLIVKVSMYILDISEVDDSHMDYTAQFYFRQSWNDSRLSYTDRNDIIRLINVDEIWTPDLFFSGGREGKLEALVHPNKFLKIMPSGEVLYSIRVTVKFFCPMDLQYFPHDTQKCKMRMESYGHTKQDIDPIWYDGLKSVGVTKDVNLYNFDLTSFNVSELSETVTTGQYKVLEVNFTFHRKFGFYAVRLYVPSIILVIVSLLSLWIKPEERGIRFILLVVILYYLTNMAFEISANIPPTPYIKGTDVWIGTCTVLVFAIFLEFIAVALIAGRQANEISESKGEMLLNMESDSKEQSMKADSPKSHLCKWVNMFDARNGGKGRRDGSAYRIDKICRIVFPLIFIVFNIVYWSVYCCK